MPERGLGAELEVVGEGDKVARGVGARAHPAHPPRRRVADVEAAAGDVDPVEVVLPVGRQVEAGAGVVGAGVEIEQREDVQVGREDVENVPALGEDGEEPVPPPRRLALQHAGGVIGVAGVALVAFGDGEDEPRIGRGRRVRIAAPGSRRRWRTNRWRHRVPLVSSVAALAGWSGTGASIPSLARSAAETSGVHHLFGELLVRIAERQAVDTRAGGIDQPLTDRPQPRRRVRRAGGERSLVLAEGDGP